MMGRFDRYLLARLMVLFGFFSLVVVMVLWVNQGVRLFDRLLASGQSLAVFLELTALTLPKVVLMVLPIAAFTASVFVANRLSNESELVVVQATGYSPWRLMRAVLAFGLIVALLASALTHLLVPLSVRELDRRQASIAQNVTAQLLTPGVFIHPVEGVTFYVREITDGGELRDVFLSDGRAAGSRTAYMAQTALLVREEGGVQLVMLNGMAQTLQLASRSLATTSFSDFAFDLGGLLPAGTGERRRVSAVTTAELAAPTQALVRETGTPRAALIAEAHERVAAATLGLVAALMGFAALLVGGFSRFGLWRQIGLGVVLLLLVKSLDTAMLDLARRDVDAWPLSYVGSLAGLAATAVLLWLAGRPALGRRGRRAA